MVLWYWSLAVFRLDFQLGREQGVGDRFRGHLQLEEPDSIDVELDEDEAIVRLVNFFQVL